ncbi:uncharacterized protein LOC126807977 [Patella vulgata]|uniref:uncharacterized protein LOC126807977 n=1 Tax=Patella vulgata TaxID=6465 RepID=UPI0024A94367|nr:uncharacterized protein LOC126807977 [Patella vulgata]
MDQAKIEIAPNMERSESKTVQTNLEMPGSKTVRPNMVMPITETAPTDIERPRPETSGMSGMMVTQELEYKMCDKKTDKLLVGASTFTGVNLSVKSTTVSREELLSTSQNSFLDGFISLHKEREKTQNQTGPEIKPVLEESESERGSFNASSYFNRISERGYRDLGQGVDDEEDYYASNIGQDTFCFDRFSGSETARTDTAGSSNVEVKDSYSYKTPPSCSVEVIPNFLSESIPDRSYEATPSCSYENIPNFLSESISSCSYEVTPSCSYEVTPSCSYEVTPSCSHEVTPSCLFEDSPSCSFEDSLSCSSDATRGCWLKELSVKKKRSTRYQPYSDVNLRDRETAKERFQRQRRTKEVKDGLRKMLKGKTNIQDQDNQVSVPNIPNFNEIFDVPQDF